MSTHAYCSTPTTAARLQARPPTARVVPASASRSSAPLLRRRVPTKRTVALSAHNDPKKAVQQVTSKNDIGKPGIDELKGNLKSALRETGGDSKAPQVEAALAALAEGCVVDVSADANMFSGEWTCITKADFPDVVRTDEKGRPVYTLARMSFNMFSPGETTCAINTIVQRSEETKIAESATIDEQTAAWSLTYDVEVEFEVLDGPAAGLTGTILSCGGATFSVDQQPGDKEGAERGGRVGVTFSGGSMQAAKQQSAADLAKWSAAFGGEEKESASSVGILGQLGLWVAKLMFGIEQG
eukprot:CAMPEP_0198201950 /NCGR_PEP_ID=MMETSP1445-20131203/4988_1 /TAXON_ID=36898 /ORGANISM="Pyramimonas sp., Strain CCMP2087" /LENGTH=297 /DNA_ID=CAMNT_0043872627 /DNA_START=344 /DNA_END=1233 /DNA_ORIENTATION=+